MHIPDGYLSPQTCAVGAALMLPGWTTAGKRLRKTVKSRYVPLLAIGAAYAFLVMMLNVPIPDGTSAHAVGAVLIAVVLGPWAAVVAVSIALAIQALFFGDGGVLAYGVNCFNMALVMPIVGYYGVYKPLTRKVSLTSPRRAFAAALGGYVGIVAAAVCCAIELGIQPSLFHTANGAPLYAPYHLAQTLPAMLLAHFTLAGGVEFALTLGVILYLQRANLPIMRINHDAVPETDADLVATPDRIRWWYGLAPIAVMAAMTPLGLLYNSGAYGEDNPRNDPTGFLQKNHLSALPSGLNHYTQFWHHALFDGYDLSHDAHPSVGYIISALVGALVISAVLFAMFGIARLVRKGRGQVSDDEDLMDAESVHA
jgi:cobalt/nickel transport system permease protein